MVLNYFFKFWFYRIVHYVSAKPWILNWDVWLSAQFKDEDEVENNKSNDDNNDKDNTNNKDHQGEDIFSFLIYLFIFEKIFFQIIFFF